MADGNDEPDRDEWERRAHRVATELTALAVGAGIAAMGDNFVLSRVFADPADPNDDDPTERRQYFVVARELVHGHHGVVTGQREVRYELKLERVGVEPPAD